MSAFVDASVIVAILSQEPDALEQTARLEAAAPDLRYSSVVVYEATVGLARKKAGAGRRMTPSQIEEAREIVLGFLRAIQAREAPISGDVALIALDAGARFGKIVGHPASLNMGDCFAYACARHSGVPLLYKGADFARTDIASGPIDT